MNAKMTDRTLTIELEGKIDTNNSAQVEQMLLSTCSGYDYDSIVLDAEKLEYVSSAGLRVILRLRKKCGQLKIINASNEVYDILEMTGFTMMMPVEKAYRHLSVDGCEMIGAGAKGRVYRLDQETIIKVYMNPDSLAEIHKERELARTAFILGVPTAISYDVVKVGEYFGSVFELLNAASFSEMMTKDPSRIDECVERSVELLKTVHNVQVDDSNIPDMKWRVLGWADMIEGLLPADKIEKLKRILTNIPDSDVMLHGDFQLNNIMQQGAETLLIDMDTLCHGDPIFELANMFAAYVGFGENCPGETMEFFGLPEDVCENFWKKSLTRYLGFTLDQQNDSNVQQVVLDTENKVKVVGYTRLIKWMVSHQINKTEADRKRMEQYKAELMEALDSVEDLKLPIK